MKHVFAMPLLIAVTSLTGLIAALLGNGVYDWLSWLGLSLPLLAVAIAMSRKA
ncbi:MAG: hypothetical protein MI745_09800 [Pseudomonadales bacterium]|nr:hypothetical protein [Pseudomonadales bacterium]